MNKFEEILKKNGVTKVEFAEKLGINQTNVNRLFKKYEKNLSEIDNSFKKVGITISNNFFSKSLTEQEERINKLLNTIEKQSAVIEKQNDIINNLLTEQKKTIVQQDGDAGCATA